VCARAIFTAFAGRDLGQEPRHLDVQLVGGDGEERVGEPLALGEDRRECGLVAVAERGHADAAAEVDELVAVDIGEDRALSPVDVDGQERRDGGRDELLALRVQLPGAGAGHLGAHALGVFGGGGGHRSLL
jgi:hypothetical protein